MIEKKMNQAVLTECEKALVNLGFNRSASGILNYKLEHEFLGWVGLNIGIHVDFVRINPSIGIHYVPLMELIDEIEGRKYKYGKLATYAEHLAAICPDVDEFKFFNATEVKTQAQRLAETIFDYGLPRIKELASHQSLLSELNRMVSSFGGYPQRVAGMYYLQGDIEKARAFITNILNEYKERPALHKIIATFANSFLRKLDSA